MRNRDVVDRLNRAQLEYILEDVCGCATYYSESDHELREAVRANIEDETVSERDVECAAETLNDAEDSARKKLSDLELRALGLR